MGRESEIPRNAVYAAKNDTEDGKDDHARVVIAFGAWSVERRNVDGSGTDLVGCNDLEGGSKREGGNEEDGKEWAEDEEYEDKKKKSGRHGNDVGEDEVVI